MRGPGTARLAPAASALAATGCRGPLDMFQVKGPQAERIASLLVVNLWVLLAVFGIVMALLLAALVRGRRRGRDLLPIVHPPRTADEAPYAQPVEEASHPTEKRLFLAVAFGVALTVVILIALLIASYGTGKALAAHGAPDAPVIEITGHQWWWEVRYLDPEPSRILTDANEVHIPAGRPVRLELKSTDVIHSFWVPQLHGKRDLIPGNKAQIVIEAAAPGEYPGTCAEFCGLQHAHMSFVVIAHPEAGYRAWKDAALRPAKEPVTPEQKRGQELFLTGPCAMCHTIGGTIAQSRVGPDLTHLASRRTLASGILPNVRGHLAGWISDPQAVKPGVRMPPNPFAPDDLRALLAYLESLE